MAAVQPCEEGQAPCVAITQTATGTEAGCCHLSVRSQTAGFGREAPIQRHRVYGSLQPGPTAPEVPNTGKGKDDVMRVHPSACSSPPVSGKLNLDGIACFQLTLNHNTPVCNTPVCNTLVCNTPVAHLLQQSGGGFDVAELEMSGLTHNLALHKEPHGEVELVSLWAFAQERSDMDQIWISAVMLLSTKLKTVLPKRTLDQFVQPEKHERVFLSSTQCCVLPLCSVSMALSLPVLNHAERPSHRSYHPALLSDCSYDTVCIEEYSTNAYRISKASDGTSPTAALSADASYDDRLHGGSGARPEPPPKRRPLPTAGTLWLTSVTAPA
ncbi:hypothetical protein P4O66_008695, partial [Electrophorus voltai]